MGKKSREKRQRRRPLQEWGRQWRDQMTCQIDPDDFIEAFEHIHSRQHEPYAVIPHERRPRFLGGDNEVTVNTADSFGRMLHIVEQRVSQTDIVDSTHGHKNKAISICLRVTAIGL